MRLLVDGGLPIAGGLIGAGGEIAWPRPTRPGDVLRVESAVEAVTPSRSRPDRGLVTVRSETLEPARRAGAGAGRRKVLAFRAALKPAAFPGFPFARESRYSGRAGGASSAGPPLPTPLDDIPAAAAEETGHSQP